MNLLKHFFLFVLFFSSISGFSQELKPSEVRNLEINSKYVEMGIKFIQNNKVLFASSKKDKTNGKRDRRNNRHLGLRLYIGSILEDGAVVNVKVFNTSESNPIHESNITFTADFKTVYFTRNNYISDDYRKLFNKDTLDTHILKIFRASMDEKGNLSNISSLPINSSNYSVTNPQLSPDGKKLLFISNMESSYGGFDIYEIDIYSDGTYSKPKNLGKKINTSEDELFPFFDRDNAFYFSSNGHGGLGDLDIFSATFDGTIYSNPINLGAPINSTDDDFAFVFSKQKNVGYFSSTRRGSIGDADIYTFNALPIAEEIIVDSITPPVIAVVTIDDKPKPCIQIIEGTILNAKNKKLSNATVTLYENGNNMGTSKVSPEGKYLFEVKCSNHYRVTARLDKFEDSYYELRTTRLTGTITNTNITLDKIPCDVLLTGELKDINTNKILKGVNVYLIENNTQIHAVKTNASGNYSFTVECDGDYKITTNLFGYEERVFDVDKSSIHNTTIILNNVLTPIVCSQIINGKIMDSTSGLEVINATVALQNSKGEVIEIVATNTNGNFHFNINCNENFKIKVSNKNYITSISEFKSMAGDKKIQRLDFMLILNSCQQTILGSVINLKTKLAMSNVNVSLIKSNKVISTIKSNSLGTFKFEVDCNSEYKISATVKDFSFQTKTILTDNLSGDIIDYLIVLETKLDFEIVRNKKMILINQIDFDLNESNIRDDAASELNKIVAVMNINTEIKVNIGVHTDSRAPDTYNLNLSEQRAQSIMSYLISKGINPKRLTGRGYGETQLLNECENGVKCTETEHSINRRIEFLVTK